MVSGWQQIPLVENSVTKLFAQSKVPRPTDKHSCPQNGTNAAPRQQPRLRSQRNDARQQDYFCTGTRQVLEGTPSIFLALCSVADTSQCVSVLVHTAIKHHVLVQCSPKSCCTPCWGLPSSGTKPGVHRSQLLAVCS